MKTANIFGPFVGELTWEFFRFAPYAVFLKKRTPKRTLIVFTRPERFDLYGQYADIFVPLNIKERESDQDKFGLVTMEQKTYESLARIIAFKYGQKYRIVNHFYPNNNGIYRKIKWQFPRRDMVYDFIPRKENIEIVDSVLKGKKDYVFLESGLEDWSDKFVSFSQFKFIVEDYIDNITTTEFGCAVELIKRSKVVIGNFLQPYTRLAVLLKKPVIALNESLTEDAIGLLNPFKMPVIFTENIEEGIKKYEDSI